MIKLKIGQVIDTSYRTFGRTRAARIEELTADDSHIPVYTNNTDTIVTLSTDSARYMSTMAVSVHRVTIIIDSTVTVYVIDHAVAVIIDTITRDLIGVSPDITL